MLRGCVQDPHTKSENCGRRSRKRMHGKERKQLQIEKIYDDFLSGVCKIVNRHCEVYIGFRDLPKIHQTEVKEWK